MAAPAAPAAPAAAPALAAAASQPPSPEVRAGCRARLLSLQTIDPSMAHLDGEEVTVLQWHDDTASWAVRRVLGSCALRPRHMRIAAVNLRAERASLHARLRPDTPDGCDASKGPDASKASDASDASDVLRAILRWWACACACACACDMRHATCDMHACDMHACTHARMHACTHARMHMHMRPSCCEPSSAGAERR